MLSIGAFLACTSHCCLWGVGGGDRYCLEELASLARVTPRKRAPLGLGPAGAAGTSRGHLCDEGDLGGEASQGSLALTPSSSPGGTCPVTPVPCPVGDLGTHWGLVSACPVFLALLPVPGSRGHRLGQLLHHRSHRPGRPLCEGPADPGAGHLLHLHPRRKVGTTQDPLP